MRMDIHGWSVCNLHILQCGIVHLSFILFLHFWRNNMNVKSVHQKKVLLVKKATECIKVQVHLAIPKILHNQINGIRICHFRVIKCFSNDVVRPEGDAICFLLCLMRNSWNSTFLFCVYCDSVPFHLCVYLLCLYLCLLFKVFITSFLKLFAAITSGSISVEFILSVHKINNMEGRTVGLDAKMS